MGQWVAAFVGENARENYAFTRANGGFWVSSFRTPIRKARPGDRALLYMSGEGFVGEAVVASGARAPYGEVSWTGDAALGISLRDVRIFSFPVPYKFPQKGPHLTLGFHRYALTGGFTSLSEEGLEDVLAWAGTPEVSPEKAPERVPSPASETRIAERPAAFGHRPARPVANDEVLEKRSAGQHAMGKARKQIVLWTIAETLTQAVGWKEAHKNARDKALDAQRTWLKGGRAEKQVGAELERLREHGFYIFHDVQLPDLGNVDHVALGPRGFFGIETKSQSGGVRARGNQLLLNGRPPGKDFVSQTWSGCFRLKDILGAEVSPLLCFTEAFVEGRVFVRGVRVLPLRWLVEEILRGEVMHDSLTVAKAVSALGAATGCYPSSVPRAKG